MSERVILCCLAVIALTAATQPIVSSSSSSSSSISSASSVSETDTDCDFERPCGWEWTTLQKGFRLVTGHEVNNSWVPGDGLLGGPFADSDNNTHGHFLYLLVKKSGGPKEFHVKSPKFVRTGDGCKLSLWVHMSNLTTGSFRAIVYTVNHTQWVLPDRPVNNSNSWQNVEIRVGKITQEFNILLAVSPGNKTFPLHFAIDNIKLRNCFPEPPQNECLSTQFQCSNNACIDITKVCDIEKDCEDGEDEEQDCNDVPAFARCTFEDGWCGWHNKGGNHMNWTLNNGSTSAQSTGPTSDHTYKNSTGMYIYVDMSGKKHDMGAAAELESPIINPPPRYHNNISSPFHNSCFITFFYHKSGMHSGSLGLFLVEMQESTNASTKLWWGYGNKGNKWLRQVVILPNITNRYYFQFEARKSYSSRGDPAIDDISLSPKCFGYGVPPEHLDGYDYDSGFPMRDPPKPPETHKDFVNSTMYRFTTCGARGRLGPTPEQCDEAYNNTEIKVTVLKEKTMAGIQKWVVPETGYYTIIAKGASGGKGSDGQGVSRGAMVRTIVELKKGQTLYILVGQEGNESCRKNFGRSKKTECQRDNRPHNLKEVIKLKFLSEGGGGGGASYVFTMRNKEKRPLVIAAGGGGLGHGSNVDDTIQHGHGINITLSPTAGNAHGNEPAGAGGGWSVGNFSHREVTGLSLLQGALGGRACYESRNSSDKGAGGFGGGGGGCTAGGGGGGFTGGRAWAHKGGKGEGGYSWIETGILRRVWVSPWPGPGELLFIPAIAGCGCDYLCVVLDPHRSITQCLCPDKWHLSNDSVHCIINPTVTSPYLPTIALVLLIAVTAIIAFVGTVMFNNYKKKKSAMLRRKNLSGPDLQLNSLRVASDSMMTEYNPNYEFGGGVYSLRDLNEIPREHLRLVKALGQGAFGEVYQGFYKHRPGDAVEMPVAVKTLPELSTSQAETDFLMEALIMSKFNHPNIVHFIGVCFDKHPRFIVIELLAGGDLKTFLRESRPKPDRASPLTMKDLISCMIDIAKGCKYMEEHRFIHRDIASRNCLLTSKGPGRVVKIADFGMARDIYRADYYRKGGKAMLPIKWMPPEAFLDGIFTSKTDVWSFGILMWEVMSMGYMPYTGCTNREVMSVVTNGGRLAPPNNCPPQVYAIMTQCWQPNPEDRPSFALILDRIGYCLQDPDVLRTPLPVYSKPPPSERDTTVMRPSTLDDGIQTDYLVPLSKPQDWEFPQQILPESRSTQRLLDNSSSSCSTASPATTVINMPIVGTANGNATVVPDSPSSVVDKMDQPVFIVSSNIKQDTEVTC